MELDKKRCAKCLQMKDRSMAQFSKTECPRGSHSLCPECLAELPETFACPLPYCNNQIQKKNLTLVSETPAQLFDKLMATMAPQVCEQHRRPQEDLCLDPKCTAPKALSCLKCLLSSHRDCDSQYVFQMGQLVSQMTPDFGTVRKNLENFNSLLNMNLIDFSHFQTFWEFIDGRCEWLMKSGIGQVLRNPDRFECQYKDGLIHLKSKQLSDLENTLKRTSDILGTLQSKRLSQGKIIDELSGYLSDWNEDPEKPKFSFCKQVTGHIVREVEGQPKKVKCCLCNENSNEDSVMLELRRAIEQMRDRPRTATEVFNIGIDINGKVILETPKTVSSSVLEAEPPKISITPPAPTFPDMTTLKELIAEEVKKEILAAAESNKLNISKNVDDSLNETKSSIPKILTAGLLENNKLEIPEQEAAKQLSVSFSGHTRQRKYSISAMANETERDTEHRINANEWESILKRFLEKIQVSKDPIVSDVAQVFSQQFELMRQVADEDMAREKFFEKRFETFEAELYSIRGLIALEAQVLDSKFQLLKELGQNPQLLDKIKQANQKADQATPEAKMAILALNSEKIQESYTNHFSRFGKAQEDMWRLMLKMAIFIKFDGLAPSDDINAFLSERGFETKTSESASAAKQLMRSRAMSQSRFFSDSGILDPESAKLLKSYLPPIQTTRLLFQAPQKGIFPTSFHVKCDSRKMTVIIAKAGDEIFGGFSDVSWKLNGQQSSNSAFIFSLNRRQKLTISDPRQAVWCNPDDGPCFGSEIKSEFA